MGEMRRGLTVLKMRGSQHDKRIREYHVTGDGMEIGAAFTGAAASWRVRPRTISGSEGARMGNMFSEDSLA